MADNFGHDEKFKLYTYLMQNGFEAFQKASPNTRSDIAELKTLFEAYKKNDNPDIINDWICEVLNLKQHYKHEALYNLLSDVMLKKAESFSPNNLYREVYLFLSKILVGKFPDIQNTSDHTIMIILLLIQDLNQMIQSVNCPELKTLLKSTEAREGPESAKMPSELMRPLMTLYKFQRLKEFMNPLQISSSTNAEVYKALFK